MRVAIAGAGAVGRSIAAELVADEHQVMLIEREARQFEPHSVEQAEWVLADACELSSLEEAGIQTCDVVIAASGDDKVNLVVSLLAKTVFAVRRVVARVNDPANEWLFNEGWGVDVAVSTPRILADLVEMTLPEDTPLAGRAVRDVHLPRDAALVTILRGGRVIVPQPDDPLEAGDELLFVASADVENEIRTALGY
jgi:trk system potassium uptake protein TrkA